MTAAFITCIYTVVAAAVIGVGLLGLRLSLPVALSTVAARLAATALGAAVWHVRTPAP